VTLAYLIRAHHRPSQLARLVDRLTADGAHFYVHVSAGTSAATFAEMQAALRDRGDVTWTPRIETRYGGFSLLRATLEALRLIAEAGAARHVVQLSGQDYPLRPGPAIVDAFERRAGESLLVHFALPADEWADEHGGLDRIRYFHVERIRYRARVLRLPLPRRRFPRGYAPYGGSAFWALSEEAVAYLMGFTEENPDFVRFFQHALIPDELYVPTVLLNSPLRDRVVNESVHYIEWPGGVHPKTLTSADFDALAGSGKLFARKFDDEADAAVLDRIDRELLAAPAGEPAR
jgi:hypothetical protein